MSNGKSFGKLIREAREQLGWTQTQLADKFDTAVSRITVGRWEKDEQRLTFQNFEELIGILDLNEQEAYALYYAGGKTPPERQNLPLPNHLFSGREAYLVSLCELLKQHRIVALSGLGGIGKTQIALKYAHRYHPDVYPTALWVNAADTGTLQSGFASLAETLELPEKDEVEQAKRIKAVRGWLEKHTDWLLVMDNADELLDVEQFLLSRPRGHIILTTRWQFPDEFAEPLTIEVMDSKDGRQFLLRRTNRSLEGAELDAVDQLVEMLGGLALALDQAGAYILETGTSFADYLKLYEENRRSLLDQHGALNDVHSEQPLTVAATFQASFAKVREITLLAEDILHFCAFLQPDAIPEVLFQPDDNFQPDDARMLDALAFNKGIAALQRYSLIKRNAQEKTLSLHRLVQVVLIDSMLPDLQVQWKGRVLRALNAALPDVTLANWNEYERLLQHALFCATWQENELLPGDILLVIRVCMYISFYLRDQGRFSEAETLMARALSFHENYGAEHPKTASVHGFLGDIYTHQGRYEEAEPHLIKALTIHESKLGAEHDWTVESLDLLIYHYYAQGKFEQAEPLLERIVSTAGNYPSSDTGL